MKTITKREELTTIEQLCQFLEGSQPVVFKINTLKEERYQWVQHELYGLSAVHVTRPARAL